LNAGLRLDCLPSLSFFYAYFLYLSTN